MLIYVLTNTGRILLYKLTKCVNGKNNSNTVHFWLMMMLLMWTPAHQTKPQHTLTDTRNFDNRMSPYGTHRHTEIHTHRDTLCVFQVWVRFGILIGFYVPFRQMQRYSIIIFKYVFAPLLGFSWCALNYCSTHFWFNFPNLAHSLLFQLEIVVKFLSRKIIFFVSWFGSDTFSLSLSLSDTPEIHQ